MPKAKTSPMVSKPSITPDAASLLTQDRIEQAIRLRYSPFPELTMGILSAQLNQFRTGELRAAARTWEIMIERDGELSGPMNQRYASAARLPWEIEKTEDSAEADAHAAALQYFYTNLTASDVLDQNETGGANLLFRQMMKAKAFRYNVHEILLRVNNAANREVTAHFNCCPTWMFESKRGYLGFLPQEGIAMGIPLESGQWLPAVGEGLMKPCSIAYGIKHFALRDNMLFASRFGLPGIHGETTASYGSKEWNDFVDSLKQFANDWVTATSPGAKINLIEAAKGGSGTLPFTDLMERTDRLYARLFRGGDLAGKSRSGNDVVGASLQAEEQIIMLADDGQWLTDSLNGNVDEPIIAYLFNAQPKAWIRVRPPKQVDVSKETSTLNAAKNLGIPVGMKTARDRLMIPAPEDGEELISGANPEDVKVLGNSADSDLIARNAAQVLQPILKAYDERLQRILTITDPVLRKQRWEEIQAELATLEKDHLTDPMNLVRAFEQINAKALVAGLTEKKTTA